MKKKENSDKSSFEYITRQFTEELKSFVPQMLKEPYKKLDELLSNIEQNLIGDNPDVSYATQLFIKRQIATMRLAAGHDSYASYEDCSEAFRVVCELGYYSMNQYAANYRSHALYCQEVGEVGIARQLLEDLQNMYSSIHMEDVREMKIRIQKDLDNLDNQSIP